MRGKVRYRKSAPGVAARTTFPTARVDKKTAREGLDVGSSNHESSHRADCTIGKPFLLCNAACFVALFASVFLVLIGSLGNKMAWERRHPPLLAMPLPLHTVNLLGTWAGALGVTPSMNKLEFPTLAKHIALAEPGLDGGDDTAFDVDGVQDDGFVVSARTLLSDARRLSLDHGSAQQLTEVGRRSVVRAVSRALRNRLRTAEFVRRHRAALDRERVVAPVFVVGMPHAGQALVAKLLSQRAGLRPLRYFEAHCPAGASGTGFDVATAAGLSPRFDQCFRDLNDSLESDRMFWPDELAASLPRRAADSPVDVEVLRTYGVSPWHPEARMNLTEVSAYGQWLRGADVLASLQHLQLQLKVLQLRLPTSAKRWVLSSDFLLPHLEDLQRAFPDASIVWVHRSPDEAVASHCVSDAQRLATMHTAVSLQQVGVDVLARATRAASVLHAQVDARISHVLYADFAEDRGRAVCLIASTVRAAPCDDTPSEPTVAPRNDRSPKDVLAQFGVSHDDVATLDDVPLQL